MATRGVQFVAYFGAWDIAADTWKTGDAANIALRWVKDGTGAATTNACAEIDATNSPGRYKVTITATEADCLSGELNGKSSTAGIIVKPEAYRFDRLPNVAPGAAGGLVVIGTGTNQFKSDGAANVTALLADSVSHGGTSTIITFSRMIGASATANEPAVKLTGNGTAPGLRSQGGATGPGVAFVGGATSGAALDITTTNGHGISIVPGTSGKDGINISATVTNQMGIRCSGTAGGALFDGLLTGSGIWFKGGSSGGYGARIGASSADAAIQINAGTGNALTMVGPVSVPDLVNAVLDALAARMAV